MTQLRCDSAVLRLAIRDGYLTDDEAAELQMEVTEELLADPNVPAPPKVTTLEVLRDTLKMDGWDVALRLSNGYTLEEIRVAEVSSSGR
jgi:hypothetical protein